MINIFGAKTKGRVDRWDFYLDNIKVSIILADISNPRRKKQIILFNLFKKNSDVLKKYEILKLKMNGKKYKDYLSFKMDFFSRMHIFFDEQNQKNIKYLLKKKGCVLNNSHFLIKDIIYNKPFGGNHAKVSFTKNKLYSDKKAMSHIVKKIVFPFKYDQVDVVVGIESGGRLLSELSAFYLKKITNKDVKSLCLGKDRILNFFQQAIIKRKNILIVDDTLRTGKNLKKLKKVIQNTGGIIVGAGVICSRNIFNNNFIGIDKIYSFIFQDNLILSFRPKDCPMCKRGEKFRIL